MRFEVGKGVGLVLENILAGAREHIIVFSPYISEKYAKLLKRKKEEGVQVEVYTTGESAERLKGRVWDILGILVGVLGIALIAAWPLFIGFAVVGTLLVALGVALARRRVFFVDTKVPEPFVHAKIYVVDDKIVLSSANLTEAGMEKNVEFVLVLEGEEARGVIERVLALAERLKIEDAKG